MLKKLIALIFVLCCAACPGHQSNTSFLSNKHKKIYKPSSCNPDKPFPQMVIIPFFENATQVVPNCNLYPKHKTALSLIVFYHHWVKYFGDEDLKVKNMLEKVMITWGLNKKTSKDAYNLRGEKVSNPTIVGLTLSNTTTWVWRGRNFKIAESSLMHELVHLSLRATIGHGDRDHEGWKYHGWTESHTKLINESKEALRLFGI